MTHALKSADDLAALRRALGLFCTGVTVISADDPIVGPRGMTANAFMSGSLAPPLIVVSIQRRSRLHANVAAAGSFGVSILPRSLEREARRFAGLPIHGHDPGPSFTREGDVPVLAGALAWFVARVVAGHELGDHTLFVGEVIAFEIERPRAAPLAYHASRFTSVTSSDGTELELDPWGPDRILDLWG